MECLTVSMVARRLGRSERWLREAEAKGKIPMMIQVSLGACNTNDGKIWMAPRFIDRTDKYSAEKKNFEDSAKVWKAFEAAKGSLFILK